MTLYINTILENKFKVSLLSLNSEKSLTGYGKIRSGGRLITLIDKLLFENKTKWSQISKIQVADFGGTFSSLRVGILCGNALAYAKGKEIVGDSGTESIKIKDFELLSPIYSSEPNIGIAKKNINI